MTLHWVPVGEVLNIHLDILKPGEPQTVRSREALEAALATPQFQHHYGEMDIVRLAVSIAYEISEKQPFIQGNKRTGYSTAVMFLRANGYRLRPHNVCARRVKQMARKEISVTDLEEIARDRIERI